MGFIKNNYLLLIILLSLAPFAYFFITPDLPHTHDGLVQLPRIGAYYKALFDGHFPVRWAGYLNYGYGLPLFIFIYHAPYIVSSLFILLGATLVNSFKLSLLTSFVLSGVFMYMFASRFFEDKRKGFLVAIAYQFAPFHLVEILMRGSFGSVYAYAFLPLVLYSVWQLKEKVNFFNFALVSLSVFFLIISHNSLSLLFFGVVFLFVIFFAGKIRNLILLSVPLFFGLILSSFYWIPALDEHKFTYGDLLMKNVYMDHFAPLSHFIGFNIFNDPKFFFEGVNLNIGVFQMLALIVTVALVIRQRLPAKERKLAFYSFTIFILAFFFMTSFSGFIWGFEASSFLRQFQFPWRFMALVVFSTSLMFGSFLYFPRFNRTYSYVGLVLFIVISSIFLWKPVQGMDKIEEDYYWNFPLNTTYYGETDVIWSAGPAKSYPEERVEIIGGIGEISNIEIKNHFHKFDTSSNDTIEVVSHVQYFPGWRAYVDGSQTEIEFQDPNHRGEVTYSVPSGKHEVVVIFEESKIRFISDIVTLVGIILLLPTYYVLKKIYK